MEGAWLSKFWGVGSWNDFVFFIVKENSYGFAFGSDVVNVFGYIAYATF